jgi:4-hydroxybenzoate polyprenyltransferase
MTVRVNTKTTTQSKSDIASNRWLLARSPALLRPYILLARLDRPIGIWLLLLPGWWAIAMASGGITAMNRHDWETFILFGIGAVVMRAAGCVINDLWDRNIDKKIERTRTRPIAAGSVSVRQACVFLLVLLLCGFLILVQMNLITIMLGFLALPLIAVYPLMKRWTWWPQAFLGLVFNFGALMGWSAVTGIVQAPALFLYAAGFFWTLGYDTIYAHQDREDDLLAGIKSTALKFGEKSFTWVAAFYALALCFFLAAFYMVYPDAARAAFVVLPFVHGFWMLRTWDTTSPARSLAVFRANRDLGLVALLVVFLAAL